MDPDCLDNLANKSEYETNKHELAHRMAEYLKQTGDPRALGHGDILGDLPALQQHPQTPGSGE